MRPGHYRTLQTEANDGQGCIKYESFVRPVAASPSGGPYSRLLRFERRHIRYSSLMVSVTEIPLIRFAGAYEARAAARTTAARITAREPTGRLQTA